MKTDMIKTRLRLTVILAVSMLACLLAGCTIGFSGYDDAYREKNIQAIVTYYANGGYFSDSYILSAELWYTSGSKFYEIAKTGNKPVSRTNYDLVGWYEVAQRTVEVDGSEVECFVLDVTDDEMEAYKQDNGEYSYTYPDYSPVYFLRDGEDWLMSREDYDYFVTLRRRNISDGNINVPLLQYGEAVDSSFKLEDETHLYVAAKWIKSISINYVLAIKPVDENDGTSYITVTDTNGNSTVVNEGEVVYREYFGTSSSISRADTDELPVTVEDGTMLRYFYDADCTRPVNGASIAKPADDNTDVTVYVQYIGGNWTVLRNAANVRSMFTNNGKGNYYLLGNVDCSGLDYDISPMSAFSGRIEGNGYTISNMSFSKSAISNGTYTALFGTVSGSAEINNLTFENVDISYTVRTGIVNIYLISSRVSNADVSTPFLGGLTVKNVTVKITASDSVTIDNIQKLNDGAYQSDNWIYGIAGGADETDEQFVKLYGGVTLEGYTVIINNETAFSSQTTDIQSD